MRVRLWLGVLIAVAMTTASVDAQLGGMIRRRVTGAVKGETPKPDAAAPDTTTSRLSCEATSDSVGRLLKGMDTERAARDAALKELAAARSSKTPEQYQACQVQVMTGPEALKLSEAMSNANPSDMSDLLKFQREIQALVEKTCGPDPSNRPASKLNGQFRDARTLGRKASGLEDTCFAQLYEHMYRFCQLPSAQQTSAQNGGMSVPGSGAKVFWIFTESEAKAYAPRCAELSSLNTAIAKQDDQAAAAQKEAEAGR